MEQNRKAGFPARLEKLITSKPFAVVLSIMTAVIIWFAIVTNVYSSTPVRFYHIPVKVELTGTSAEANGLSVVDCDVETVNVELIGDRSQIGILTAENLTAYADVGNISNKGQFALSLNVKANNNIGFSVASVMPDTVNVRLDKIETRTFPVEPAFPNIGVASGHSLYWDKVLCDPPEIEITGPSAQLSEIGKVVAHSSKNMEISSSYLLYTDEVRLYTGDGMLLDTDDLEIPNVNFQVSIPVLTQEELQLTYDLIGIPSGFDQEWLRERLRLSEESITLASQTSTAFANKSLSIGYIRMSEIGLDYNATMDIQLGEEYINQSGIQQVTLSLDSEGLSSRSFIVNQDNINIINQPSNYDFKKVTKNMSVTVVGDEEVVKHLTAADIIVTVDMLDYDAEQYASESFSRPATISFYQQGKVWAVGSYLVALDRLEVQPTTMDAN